jgi:hypothetical protein
VERALARKEPPRTAQPGYRIDEQAEVERARAARRPDLSPRALAAAAKSEAQRAIQKRSRAALRKLVAGTSDPELERRVGSQAAERMLFEGMARSFVPRYAFGFEGDIVYELVHVTDGARPPDLWTITIKDDRASVSRGDGRDPAVRVRVQIPDFWRLAAGEIEPTAPIMEGRMEIEGDFQVASRLREMFGGPSAY